MASRTAEKPPSRNTAANTASSASLKSESLFLSPLAFLAFPEPDALVEMARAGQIGQGRFADQLGA
jgi:hypothetical protein